MPLIRSTNRRAFQTLLDASMSLIAHDKNRLALVYLETGQAPIELTRADLQAAILRYAQQLQSLGIQQGQLVAIVHTQNLESIYAFWACLLVGAIPAMFPTLTEKLDPQIYAQRMAELVSHSQVQALLTSDTFATQLSALVPCPVYSSTQIRVSVSAHDLQIYQAQAADIAFLQHSSGTTGLQKGVALSHQAVLNQIAHYSDVLDLQSEDVIVSWLPLYHDMGLIAGFILPMMQGIPLILMSPFDWISHPALLLRAIHAYRGTLTWLPNFAYNHMARRIRQQDSADLDLSSMRAWVNCSEPVRYQSHSEFLRRFAANGVTATQLTVCYAMAENTFAVTQTALSQAPRIDMVDQQALQTAGYAEPVIHTTAGGLMIVSCGFPLPNVQVKIVDADGLEVSERYVGEILVHSDCMLTGYYLRPDLNAPLFEGEWYRTGDMGYLVDNELFIVGRKKDLIIASGKNVYPNDLEAIVNTVEGVYQGRAVAFGVYDEREGTELIGIIAETELSSPEERQALALAIRTAIAQQSTVTANYVHIVDKGWLIKTSSGKLARSLNREKWQTEKE